MSTSLEFHLTRRPKGNSNFRSQVEEREGQFRREKADFFLMPEHDHTSTLHIFILHFIIGIMPRRRVLSSTFVGNKLDRSFSFVRLRVGVKMRRRRNLIAYHVPPEFGSDELVPSMKKFDEQATKHDLSSENL